MRESAKPLFKNQNRNAVLLFGIQNKLWILELVPECHSQQSLQFLLLMFGHMGKQLLLGGLREVAGFAQYRHALVGHPHKLLAPVYRVGDLADQSRFNQFSDQSRDRIGRQFQLGSNSGLTVVDVVVLDDPQDSVLVHADAEVRQGVSDSTDEFIVAESEEVADSLAGGWGKSLTKLHLIVYQQLWVQSSPLRTIA